jgi:uroporphyrinogen-III decarboxylase
MFRQPQKLLQALEWATPIMIQRGLESARMGNAPVVGFALHKGSDPYMSDEHFKTFYWGPWRKVMMAFIEEGLIIRGGCQGFHNKRLETYRTMPKGKVYWNIGYGTDIARAKELLGGIACISGGITAGILHQGTPDEVARHCRQAIDVAAGGGGYIFSTSNIDRHARVENVRAMIKTVKEYGVYS